MRPLRLKRKVRVLQGTWPCDLMPQEGIIYRECTTVKASAKWCATKTDDDGDSAEDLAGFLVPSPKKRRIPLESHKRTAL